MKNATKIYTNGTILTMDKKNTIAETLVTKEDKIVFVGTQKEASHFADPDSNMINLQGCTVLPGFVDAHSHFSRVGVELVSRIALNSPPVGEIDSLATLLNVLKAKAEKTPAGQWLIGVGYDDTSLKEQRHPTRQELDDVSTSHPIWLTHISNHLGVANSYALQLAGIDESISNPQGGVLRRSADGLLNGIIEENAMFLIRPYLPDITTLIPEAIKAANQAYMQVGITTANDGGVGGILGDRADFSDYLKIDDDLQKIRLVLNAYYTRTEECKTMEFLTNKIFVQGAKILADGSIQGYTAYLSKPYHTTIQNEPNYHGYSWQSREQLCQIISSLHQQGLQCYVHCNGDAAIDDVLYAILHAQAQFPREDCRHVLIHCQMARQDQLQKMQELGVIPSFFVPHIYYWGDRHRHIFLGEERASSLDPCRWAQDRKIPFTLHCDSPVVPQNPLQTIWTAVNRKTASGDLLGAKEQSITPLEALKACTCNAAHQFFLENQIGSLEPGKLADLVILDTDPLSCAPEYIKDIQVLATIVGGQCVYKK